MIETKLGKITKAEFGRIHDRPSFFGLIIGFGGESWGVGCITHTSNMSDSCTWRQPKTRSEYITDIMYFVYKLLETADVNNVSELKGIPVEVTLDSGVLKDFRILTEVL